MNCCPETEGRLEALTLKLAETGISWDRTRPNAVRVRQDANGPLTLQEEMRALLSELRGRYQTASRSAVGDSVRATR